MTKRLESLKHPGSGSFQMSDDVAEKFLSRFKEILPKLGSPLTFYETLRSNSDIFNAILYALETLVSADPPEFRKMTPSVSEIHEAILAVIDVKKKPTTLQVELLLAGGERYSKFQSFLAAEERDDLATCVSIGRDLLSGMNKELLPRFAALLSVGVGSQICKLSNANKEWSSEDAISYLEDAISLSPEPNIRILINAHTNLMCAYLAPSWDNPEFRQDKAIENGRAALRLAEQLEDYQTQKKALGILTEILGRTSEASYNQGKHAKAKQELEAAAGYCAKMIIVLKHLKETDELEKYKKVQQVMDGELRSYN
jgi:tetratricopeptide (TPR) repeat protein